MKTPSSVSRMSSAPTLPCRASRSVSAVNPEMSTKTSDPSTARCARPACRAASRSGGAARTASATRPSRRTPPAGGTQPRRGRWAGCSCVAPPLRVSTSDANSSPLPLACEVAPREDGWMELDGRRLLARLAEPRGRPVGLSGRGASVVCCSTAGPASCRSCALTRAWPELDAIAITHFHLDHWGDLVPWVWGALHGRGRDLPPRRPPAAAGRARATRGARRRVRRAGHVRAGVRDQGVRGGVAERDRGVERHGRAAEALRRSRRTGFRVRTGGATLAYSGDWAPNGGLVELARNADSSSARRRSRCGSRSRRGHLSLAEAEWRRSQSRAPAACSSSTGRSSCPLDAGASSRPRTGTPPRSSGRLSRTAGSRARSARRTPTPATPTTRNPSRIVSQAMSLQDRASASPP